jgi:membrane dipeptidase
MEGNGPLEQAIYGDRAPMNRRGFVRSAGFLAGAALGMNRVRSMAAFVQNNHGASEVRGNAPDPASIQRSTLVVNGLDPSELNERYMDMLKSGGVDCWHKTLYDVQSFADVYNFADAHPGRIVPVTTVEGVRQAQQQDRIALVMGWQSAAVLQHQPGDPPPTALRAYYQLGLRICGIAYNVANMFGSGCLEPQIGLTRAGRRLVEEIHKLKIILDVGGHTGEQTSLDALAMSPGVTIICSHTNPLALIDNPRATSDRVLEAIAGTGGVIGITAFNDFHVRTRKDVDKLRMPQVSLGKHLDHYDYLKRLVGVDHIGLGPDFIEGRPNGGGPLNRAVSSIEA